MKHHEVGVGTKESSTEKEISREHAILLQKWVILQQGVHVKTKGYHVPSNAIVITMSIVSKTEHEPKGDLFHGQFSNVWFCGKWST